MPLVPPASATYGYGSYLSPSIATVTLFVGQVTIISNIDNHYILYYCILPTQLVSHPFQVQLWTWLRLHAWGGGLVFGYFNLIMEEDPGFINY